MSKKFLSIILSIMLFGQTGFVCSEALSEQQKKIATVEHYLHFYKKNDNAFKVAQLLFLHSAAEHVNEKVLCSTLLFLEKKVETDCLLKENVSSLISDLSKKNSDFVATLMRHTEVESCPTLYAILAESFNAINVAPVSISDSGNARVGSPEQALASTATHLQNMVMPSCESNSLQYVSEQDDAATRFKKLTMVRWIDQQCIEEVKKILDERASHEELSQVVDEVLAYYNNHLYSNKSKAITYYCLSQSVAKILDVICAHDDLKEKVFHIVQTKEYESVYQILEPNKKLKKRKFYNKKKVRHASPAPQEKASKQKKPKKVRKKKRKKKKSTKSISKSFLEIIKQEDNDELESFLKEHGKKLDMTLARKGFRLSDKKTATILLFLKYVSLEHFLIDKYHSKLFAPHVMVKLLEDDSLRAKVHTIKRFKGVFEKRLLMPKVIRKIAENNEVIKMLSKVDKNRIVCDFANRIQGRLTFYHEVLPKLFKEKAFRDDITDETIEETLTFFNQLSSQVRVHESYGDFEYRVYRIFFNPVFQYDDLKQRFLSIAQDEKYENVYRQIQRFFDLLKETSQADASKKKQQEQRNPTYAIGQTVSANQPPVSDVDEVLKNSEMTNTLEMLNMFEDGGGEQTENENTEQTQHIQQSPEEISEQLSDAAEKNNQELVQTLLEQHNHVISADVVNYIVYNAMVVSEKKDARPEIVLEFLKYDILISCLSEIVVTNVFVNAASFGYKDICLKILEAYELQLKLFASDMFKEHFKRSLVYLSKNHVDVLRKFLKVPYFREKINAQDKNEIFKNVVQQIKPCEHVSDYVVILTTHLLQKDYLKDLTADTIKQVFDCLQVRFDQGNDEEKLLMGRVMMGLFCSFRMPVNYRDLMKRIISFMNQTCKKVVSQLIQAVKTLDCQTVQLLKRSFFILRRAWQEEKEEIVSVLQTALLSLNDDNKREKFNIIFDCMHKHANSSLSRDFYEIAMQKGYNEFKELISQKVLAHHTAARELKKALFEQNVDIEKVKRVLNKHECFEPKIVNKFFGHACQSSQFFQNFRPIITELLGHEKIRTCLKYGSINAICTCAIMVFDQTIISSLLNDKHCCSRLFWNANSNARLILHALRVLSHAQPRSIFALLMSHSRVFEQLDYRYCLEIFSPLLKERTIDAFDYYILRKLFLNENLCRKMLFNNDGIELVYSFARCCFESSCERMKIIFEDICRSKVCRYTLTKHALKKQHLLLSTKLFEQASEEEKKILADYCNVRNLYLQKKLEEVQGELDRKIVNEVIREAVHEAIVNDPTIFLAFLRNEKTRNLIDDSRHGTLSYVLPFVVRCENFKEILRILIDLPEFFNKYVLHTKRDLLLKLSFEEGLDEAKIHIYKKLLLNKDFLCKDLKLFGGVFHNLLLDIKQALADNHQAGEELFELLCQNKTLREKAFENMYGANDIDFCMKIFSATPESEINQLHVFLLSLRECNRKNLDYVCSFLLNQENQRLVLRYLHDIVYFLHNFFALKGFSSDDKGYAYTKISSFIFDLCVYSRQFALRLYEKTQECYLSTSSEFFFLLCQFFSQEARTCSSASVPLQNTQQEVRQVAVQQVGEPHVGSVPVNMRHPQPQVKTVPVNMRHPQPAQVQAQTQAYYDDLLIKAVQQDDLNTLQRVIRYGDKHTVRKAFEDAVKLVRLNIIMLFLKTNYDGEFFLTRVLFDKALKLPIIVLRILQDNQLKNKIYANQKYKEYFHDVFRRVRFIVKLAEYPQVEKLFDKEIKNIVFEVLGTSVRRKAVNFLDTLLKDPGFRNDLDDDSLECVLNDLNDCYRNQCYKNIIIMSQYKDLLDRMIFICDKKQFNTIKEVIQRVQIVLNSQNATQAQIERQQQRAQTQLEQSVHSLIQAVEDNDLEAVRKELADAYDNIVRNAFEKAIRLKRIEIIMLFLEDGRSRLMLTCLERAFRLPVVLVKILRNNQLKNKIYANGNCRKHFYKAFGRLSTLVELSKDPQTRQLFDKDIRNIIFKNLAKLVSSKQHFNAFELFLSDDAFRDNIEESTLEWFLCLMNKAAYSDLKSLRQMCQHKDLLDRMIFICEKKQFNTVKEVIEKAIKGFQLVSNSQNAPQTGMHQQPNQAQPEQSVHPLIQAVGDNDLEAVQKELAGAHKNLVRQAFEVAVNMEHIECIMLFLENSYFNNLTGSHIKEAFKLPAVLIKILKNKRLKRMICSFKRDKNHFYNALLRLKNLAEFSKDPQIRQLFDKEIRTMIFKRLAFARTHFETFKNFLQDKAFRDDLIDSSALRDVLKLFDRNVVCSSERIREMCQYKDFVITLLLTCAENKLDNVKKEIQKIILESSKNK